MAKLTEPIKIAIVQALACFDTPTEVAKAVKEEFGLVITRQQVAGYDPTKATCKGMAKKLRAIFESTRAAFLEDITTIPIAQQAVRLRTLQKEMEKAKASGNSVLVLDVLERAAKEIGGAFTNRRELTGKGGGPITQQTSNISPEELAAAVKSVREDY
jgi:hypothetical protein